MTMWEIEFTHEFGAWWNSLTEEHQESVAQYVGMLEARGPQLPFPYSSGVTSSVYGHMRELRVQHQGDPIRVLYAFDPLRVGILLIGGDKTGNDRWYDEFVPVADALYAEHLRTLKSEGQI
jgi:hypothetical protein